MALTLAVLSFLTVLIPILVGRYVEKAPERRREKIDEVLVKGAPVDVAAELSRLYDEAYDPAGQSADAVPGGGTAAVPAVHHDGWLP